MANSYFSIDEGVTKNLATTSRSVDGVTVHTQKVGLDEPFLATYTVWGYNLAMSVANTHVLQIMAGSTYNVGIKRIAMWQTVAASATAVKQFNLTRLTTAGTGGSAVTPNPHDLSDPASGATGMTIPSSKGTESTEFLAWFPLIHSTLATVGNQPMLDISFDVRGTQAVWIAAGSSNGLAVKAVGTDTTAQLNVVVVLVESSYI